MAMNSANDLELLSLVAKMPRASLEAVVLDMVATGHPINEGELEVAATEDEACLGACAVAPAPQVPQGLEYEAGVLSGLERDTVEQLVLRGVAGGRPADEGGHPGLREAALVKSRLHVRRRVLLPAAVLLLLSA